jgi:hypothetical protein
MQGLSLPALIRRLKLGVDDSSEQEETRARLAMLTAAMDVLRNDPRRAALPDDVLKRLETEMEDTAPENPADKPMHDAARVLKGAALAAQRAALIAEWRANHISDEVLHHLEEELDYREARL